MATNSFKPSKYEDHEIVDDNNKVVGTVRVKPSGILWSPKGSHSWLGINLDKFQEFMAENGRKQKK